MLKTKTFCMWGTSKNCKIEIHWLKNAHNNQSLPCELCQQTFEGLITLKSTLEGFNTLKTFIKLKVYQSGNPLWWL
jgi:hypothetical protein